MVAFVVMVDGFVHMVDVVVCSEVQMLIRNIIHVRRNERPGAQ